MTATAPDRPTLLMTVTGADRPGVTARLTAALGEVPVDLLDIEQIVTRGQLVLSLLVAPHESTGVEALSDAERIAHDIIADLGMRLDVSAASLADDERGRRRGDRLQVTVLGAPLRPAAISVVARTLAAHGANIDRITRVAAWPVTAVELQASGVPPEVVRGPLAQAARSASIDIAVQRVDLDRRGAHLVVMDVDSTLIQDEVVELLARHANCEPAVAEITARAMAGELDFQESLEARVALLAGLHESVLDRVQSEIRLTPGARTLCRTLRRLGYRLALVSGGFSQIVTPLAEELGIDHARANTLEIVDGRLTGKVVGRVVDRAYKAESLVAFAKHHAIPLSRTIAIGDGANDLDMLAVAGLGIAFNAKPVVREAADASVTVPYLDSVLYLLGISREMVEEAEAESV